MPSPSRVRSLSWERSPREHSGRPTFCADTLATSAPPHGDHVCVQLLRLPQTGSLPQPPHPALPCSGPHSPQFCSPGSSWKHGAQPGSGWRGSSGQPQPETRPCPAMPGAPSSAPPLQGLRLTAHSVQPSSSICSFSSLFPSTRGAGSHFRPCLPPRKLGVLVLPFQ